MSLILQDIKFRYSAAAGAAPLTLAGVSLVAAPGEIVCLFGPSGCGKTTLLRIAAGLEKASAGAVELDGETLSSPTLHIAPERRPVGFVFQDFILFPHMTVAENVAFGVAHLDAGERRRRVADELEAVGLEDFADRTPDQLSGGQQQRVALARAYARRPRAMLLDEPFASIDASTRSRLREDMRRVLKARGAPTVLVTHDPDEAVALGDRIAIMREGRIIEDATPERLFTAPVTREGALVFAGSQALACQREGSALKTAFGPIAGVGGADNPAFAIIREGGARARPDPAGTARVVDSHFAGPHWLVALEIPGAPGERLRASAETRHPSGVAMSVAFDAAAVRAVAS